MMEKEQLWTGSQEVTSSSLVRSTTLKARVFNDSGYFTVLIYCDLFIKKEHIRSTSLKKSWDPPHFIPDVLSNIGA